jgi:hypothetical protein
MQKSAGEVADLAGGNDAELLERRWIVPLMVKDAPIVVRRVPG